MYNFGLCLCVTIKSKKALFMQFIYRQAAHNHVFSVCWSSSVCSECCSAHSVHMLLIMCIWESSVHQDHFIFTIYRIFVDVCFQHFIRFGTWSILKPAVNYIYSTQQYSCSFLQKIKLCTFEREEFWTCKYCNL